MRINFSNNILFKAGYVTTCKTSLSSAVKRDVVDSFNTKNKIAPFGDLANSVNYFVLAGGYGTRMIPYIDAVKPILGEQNKITLPFPVDAKNSLRVIDFPMYLGKPFLNRDGYNTIEYDIPSGNFSDVIKFYIDNPDEVKDTLVCCGDNIYTLSDEEIKNTIVNARSDGTDVLIFASKQMPENAANKYGVLKFNSSSTPDDKSFELAEFVDMTDIKTFYKQAPNYLTSDGYCLSYPGMFYIKKDLMNWLLNKVKSNPKIIEKIHPSTLKPCPEEQYDYIAALKLIRNSIPDAKILIKPVDNWQDVGTPDAYLNFLKSINSETLQNFQENDKIKILNALAKKVKLKNKKLILSDKNSGNYGVVAQYPLGDKKIGIYTDKPISFGSKIIKTDCRKGCKLTDLQLQFLDEFEEMPELQKNKYKIASGLTADVFYIEQFKFVIKSIKDIANKQLQKNFNISLKNEGENLKNFLETKTKNVQQYIALVETEKGNSFLLTQYHEGQKIKQASQLSNLNLNNILQALIMLDKKRVINFDWNPNNILIDKNNVTLIDFQWAKKVNSFDSKFVNIVSPPFETVSNITAFETSTLAPLVLKNKNFELLEKYLKIKAKYSEQEAELIKQNNSDNNAAASDQIKFELLRSEVLKKCTPLILTAEILRLEFLYNNLQRNFFSAPVIDKPKDKEAVQLYAKAAINAAQKLANLEIPPYVPAAEKNYLDKMKEAGEYYLKYLNSLNNT